MTIHDIPDECLRLVQAGASVVANLTDANFSNASVFTISGSVRLD